MMDRMHGYNAVECVRFEGKIGNICNDKQSLSAKLWARFFQGGDGDIGT